MFRECYLSSSRGCHFLAVNAIGVEITYFAATLNCQKKWTVYLRQNENYDPAGKIRLIEFLGFYFTFSTIS